MRNILFNKVSLNKLDLFVLLVIAFLGVINLPIPFGGDQALFITGAQEMTKGKVLYRDFWDLKPPGIYYFYNIAGSLFGFTEVGIHLLELIFWLCFSFILIISLKSSGNFENKFIASIAPLFTAGIYYSLSTVFTLTQVEGLINIFLFLTLWFAIQSLKSRNKKFLLFLSGLAGSVVLTFKQMFLPIIVVFWFTTLLNQIFKQKEKFRDILFKFLLPLAAGFFLPIVILFTYFLKMDLLEIVSKTFFIYPPRLVSEIPTGSYSKLYSLFLWYIDNFYPMLAFAVFGTFIGIWYKKSLLLTNIILWFILGTLVVFMTKLSWWQYHLHLLNVPVGILFLTAVDFICSAIKKYSRISWKEKAAYVIILIVLFQPALHASVTKARFFIKYVSAQGENAKSKVLASLESRDNLYAYTYENIKILNHPDSLPGEIYVASTPLFYYLAKRNQAIPINGWILEILLKEQWHELNEQLKKRRPVYIFLDPGYRKIVADLSLETVELLKENYTIISNSKGGIWFISNDGLTKSKISN